MSDSRNWWRIGDTFFAEEDVVSVDYNERPTPKIAVTLSNGKELNFTNTPATRLWEHFQQQFSGASIVGESEP